MSAGDPPDERVIYRERFQGVHFDFRGKIVFTRYDRCEFVKCTLQVDHATEQLAFTACVFQDCNIDELLPDEARGFYATDNFAGSDDLCTNWLRVCTVRVKISCL
jgi:hypothetical protein